MHVRVEGVLGRGGMGTVYAAQNLDLPRREAIKVLPEDLSADPDFRARFIQEADVAAGFTHPNIVRVFRRGETDDGHLWIAMQLVQGTDAAAEVRGTAMGPERALHVITDIAKALDYAHARGVIHRDVKPANFLLSGPPGPDERVLLADFGIARALSSATMTATGSMVATVAYAAPEVLTGAPIDHRADVYSLGCAFYQLLTGQTPYPGVNGVASVMMAHLQNPPPRISALRPDLAALDPVITTAMAKDPALRFGSAGQLAAAAAQALYGCSSTALAPVFAPPVASQPPARSVPVATRASQRQRRGWLAAVAVLAVALVATVIVVLKHGNTPTSPADATGVQATRSGVAPTSAPPVPAAALSSLLVGSEHVSALLGARLTGQTVNTALGDDARQLAEKDCASPWGPALQITYKNSNWQGVAIQLLNETNPPPDDGRASFVLPRYAVQSLIAFPDSATATTFVDSQKPIWAACANRTLTFLARSDLAVPITLGDYALTPAGVLTMPQTLQNAGDNSCMRALAARNNVAIDVTVCGHDHTAEQANALVDTLAANISAHR